MRPSDTPSRSGRQRAHDMTSAELRVPWRPTLTRALTWLRPNAVLVVLAILVIYLSVKANNFLTVRNWMNILDQNAPLMLIALGTTFVIVSGGFDLSTGALMALGGVIGVKLTYNTADPLLGVVLGILAGVGLGIANGILVGILKINSFLATLASGLVMGGLALYTTNGASIDLTANSTFTWLGTHRYGQVPASVIVEVLVAVLLAALLARTTIGRRVYLVGSNEEAARLSGISPGLTRLIAYSIGGLTAAIGGAILLSRTGVGTIPTGTQLLTLNAIAAVVIGGTSIQGGRGTIWRTFAGVLILALIQNAFTLLNIEPYLQQVFAGLIIVVVVYFDRETNR